MNRTGPFAVGPRAQCSCGAVVVLVVAFLAPGGAVAQFGAAGLSAVRSHRFAQDTGVPTGSNGASIGWALAAGDFNGDGAADLAFGAPFYDAPFAGACGAAEVRYGQPGKGLANALSPTVLGQFSPGSTDPAESGDHFGWALVACNLNGDLYADLAVGVPAESLVVGGNSIAWTGVVEVYYGTSSGLSPLPNWRLRERGAPGQPDVPTHEARFGSALGCGDFNADGFDDLAVGAPLRTLPSGAQYAGRLNIFPGSLSGVGASYKVLDQTILGDGDAGETFEQFGSALAAGDFDGDGDDDLAIGVPQETASGGGGVHFVHGGPGGMPNGSYLLRVSDLGSSFAGQGFGSALATGDFDDDGYDDLVAGWPDSYVANQDRAGNAFVLYGSSLTIDLKRTQQFNEESFFAPGNSLTYERFGAGVAAGDFDGDGVDDIAVGAPGEDWSSQALNVGAVFVMAGVADTGIGTNRYMLLLGGHWGIPATPLATGNYYWGEAMAAGDFDGNGMSDLAVGAPDEYNFNGAVTILYGALFADGFEMGSPIAWSRQVP